MQVNQPAPDFELSDLHGRLHRLSKHRGAIVVVNFWSCDCPHSERTDEVIRRSSMTWGDRVVWLSIASNRNESADCVKKAAAARGNLTVLLDADHAIADLYDAVTTPHIFVLDDEGILRYQGAVDDLAFRRNRTPIRFFLNEVVDSLIEGHLPPLTETTAYGCAIVREI